LDVIEVEDLKKRFGLVEALREVSFRVEHGSATGLLGPNGAGKTTTMKILVGLLKPTGGRATVLGMDPWREGHKVRQRVGVLHEKPSYPKGVSVRRLLEYAVRIRGLDHTEVSRVTRLVGLAEVSSRRVGALSRGYLQRLGLALAIIGEPEVLLLDEPTANLDPAARIEILNLIDTLKRELGVTMLISSHIIPELEPLCDSAIFIAEGRVLDYGTLEELARRHGTEAYILLEAERPRELASKLISLDFVRSVEVDGSLIRVRVLPGSLEEAEIEISRAKGSYRLRVLSSGRAGLLDLYGRVVGGETPGENLRVPVGGAG